MRQGATWWSGKFLRSLERLGLTSSLRRGRPDFQNGKVVQFEVGAGFIAGRVQGPESFHCRIHVEPFSDLEWGESLERLAFQDLSAAALLSTGRLPPQIEDFFRPSGRQLLPTQSSELEFECSCGNGGELCKHLASTIYLFAEHLDRDPWLLFTIRGRSAEAVTLELTSLWNRDQPALPKETMPHGSNPEPEPIPEDPDLFWNGPKEEDIPHSAPPSPAGITAQRLGIPEPKIEEKAWRDLLCVVYLSVSRQAGSRRIDPGS